MTFVLASMIAAVASASPHDLVARCRAMLPESVGLAGRIVMRNRRGVVQAEHSYDLVRTNSTTSVSVDGKRLEPPSSGVGSVMGTDVTWSDLSLEYLWWDDSSVCDESETVNGQMCSVVEMKKGDRTVRLWIDRKTGALMQAEETKDGKAVRRLWGTRIKKFGDRWMANVMEVETIGSGHRTKITVDSLR